MRWSWWTACTLLAACGDDAGDGGGGGGASPSLVIVSPADGAWLDQGEAVVLEARGFSADGAEVEPRGVAWSAGDWSAEGNGIEVTDLPAGELELVATAEVSGVAVEDAITIYVFATTDDTGGARREAAAWSWPTSP